ncbi:hypothetical protein PYCC9005_000610 [Savitreella phatthalungensis]
MSPSLGARRPNAPQHLSFYSNFQSVAARPNSPIALESAALDPPDYSDALAVDTNPDVITTSVELTSDDEEEDEDFEARHPGLVRSVDQTPRATYPADRKLLRPRRSSISKDAVRSPRKLIGDLIQKTAVTLSVRPTSPEFSRDSSICSQGATPQFILTRRPSLPSSGFPEELPASVQLGIDMDEHEYACRIGDLNELLERGEVRAARKAVHRVFDGKIELVRFNSAAMHGATRANMDHNDDIECTSVDECASDVSSQSHRIERGHKRSTITYVHDDDDADIDEDSGPANEFDVASLASSLTRSLRKWNPARRFSAISQTNSLNTPLSVPLDDEIEFAGYVPHEVSYATATATADRSRLPHEAWCLLFH